MAAVNRGVRRSCSFRRFTSPSSMVTVENQVVAPGCPRSARSRTGTRADQPNATLNQVCQDKLETLGYTANSAETMPEAVSPNQPGVTVEIKNYGTTDSAPFYEQMYITLEAAGYMRDQDIRVAGYDARLTPDMGGFLERTSSTDRGHVPGQRQPAGAPRRPLERPALRAVPAHPHQPGAGRISTSTASRRSPATSRARVCSTRSYSPG